MVLKQHELDKWIRLMGEKQIQTIKYVLSIKGICQPFHSKELPDLEQKEKLFLESSFGNKQELK